MEYASEGPAQEVCKGRQMGDSGVHHLSQWDRSKDRSFGGGDIHPPTDVIQRNLGYHARRRENHKAQNELNLGILQQGGFLR